MDITTNKKEEKEEFKLIRKTAKDIEIEVMVAKEIPNLIRKKLIEKKIDSYVYTPHPILNGPRISIHSSNPASELISASEDVENDLKEFKELLNKEFKKVKKEYKEENRKDVRKEKKPEKVVEDKPEKKEVKSVEEPKLPDEKLEKVGKHRGRSIKE
ncbi:MAG: hypothetical protein BWK75_00430 [Candidatus Altiarchaeales archaeon A3]|nr:MAG: hypothetical protein BWK75_00430 [Candidatus Altiarchaeales archaeon A3]